MTLAKQALRLVVNFAHAVALAVLAFGAPRFALDFAAFLRALPRRH